MPEFKELFLVAFHGVLARGGPESQNPTMVVAQAILLAEEAYVVLLERDSQEKG